MELKFTPKKIMLIEKEKGIPLAEIISRYDMGTLALFVQKGMEISEDEAFAKIEEYLMAEHDIIELYFEIIESLQKQGFLVRKLDLNSVKAKMEKALQQAV